MIMLKCILIGIIIYLTVCLSKQLSKDNSKQLSKDNSKESTVNNSKESPIPFSEGDLVVVKTQKQPMVFIGTNGFGNYCCRYLDGTNQWSAFDPLTIEKYIQPNSDKI